MKPKVFDLSLMRTGSKSLAMAMHCLGYRACHGPDKPKYGVDFQRKVAQGRRDFRLVDDHDFIGQMGFFYRDWDELYPDAKFIMLLRNNHRAWLRSCKNHFDKRKTRCEKAERGEVEYGVLLRMLMFEGSAWFNRDRYSKCYDRHCRTILRYFYRKYPHGDRHFLAMEITEGWEPLCKFLGVSPPPIPFPRIKNRYWKEKQALVDAGYGPGLWEPEPWVETLHLPQDRPETIVAASTS